jgi:hypothetical protein
LSISEARGQRLVITENFGNVLGDVLVKRDGSVHVMRSSEAFRPEWIKRFVAADLKCVCDDSPKSKCPVTVLSPTHIRIKHFFYSVDLQTIEVKPGVQPAEMFDETKAVK